MPEGEVCVSLINVQMYNFTRTQVFISFTSELERQDLLYFSHRDAQSLETRAYANLIDGTNVSRI